MNKTKVEIIKGFKKTSSFGWRFVPKWKRDFIKLNGVNAFETATKGLTINKELTRDIFFTGLMQQKYYTVPKNTRNQEDVFAFHNGLDFVGSDTNLLAIADGVITEVETSDLSGNYIKVEHIINGVKYLLSYCHLATHTPQIKGNKVVKGEWIAVMGNTGTTSTGVHCHLTVRNLTTQEIINPEDIFEFI